MRRDCKNVITLRLLSSHFYRMVLSPSFVISFNFHDQRVKGKIIKWSSFVRKSKWISRLLSWMQIEKDHSFVLPDKFRDGKQIFSWRRRRREEEETRQTVTSRARGREIKTPREDMESIMFNNLMVCGSPASLNEPERIFKNYLVNVGFSRDKAHIPCQFRHHFTFRFFIYAGYFSDMGWYCWGNKWQPVFLCIFMMHHKTLPYRGARKGCRKLHGESFDISFHSTVFRSRQQPNFYGEQVCARACVYTRRRGGVR